MLTKILVYVFVFILLAIILFSGIIIFRELRVKKEPGSYGIHSLPFNSVCPQCQENNVSQVTMYADEHGEWTSNSQTCCNKCGTIYEPMKQPLQL